MAKRNEVESTFSIKKKLKRQKLKIGDETNQEHINIKPDTIGLEDVIRIRMNNMRKHELRDEIANQTVTDQPLLVKSKNDMDGKFVETVMLFESIDAFEIYLQSIDEHYDEGPVMNPGPDISLQIDRKIFNKAKKMIMVKQLLLLIKRLLDK